MSALIAQFPSVNQFRWVGWFSVTLGTLAFFLLLALFHGETKPEGDCSRVSKHPSGTNKKRWNPLAHITLARVTVS